MRITHSTRALLTGASKGIGRALAIRLAARGVRLGLLARDGAALRRLAAELGGEHLALPADVTDRAAVSAAVEDFAAATGGIDLLVANAGIAHYGPFADAEIELAEQMVAVNLIGSLYTVKAGLEVMLASGRPGHIVVTSSGAGLRAFPSGAVYGATKAANRGFAEALRHELSGTGISVTTIFAGEVETELHSHQLDRLPDWRDSEEAIDPDQLAAAVIEAVEADAREIYAPPAVRLLGLNGLAPGLLDRLLRRVRGPAAAPRRD